MGCIDYTLLSSVRLPLHYYISPQQGSPSVGSRHADVELPVLKLLLLGQASIIIFLLDQKAQGSVRRGVMGLLDDGARLCLKRTKSHRDLEAACECSSVVTQAFTPCHS